MDARDDGLGTLPVERFRPTGGRLLGYAGLAVVVGLVAYVAVAVHTVTGVRVALGLAWFGVLVWATQLRPRASVSGDALHLRNSFRDTTVPLVLVDEVTVRRTLNVWVGEERYVCIGIGQSLRSMLKARSRGPSALLGFDRIQDYTERSTPPRPDQSAMSYASFVETRIDGLVAEARRRRGSTPDQRPRHSWAWPEIAALAALAAALAATLLV